MDRPMMVGDLRHKSDARRPGAADRVAAGTRPARSAARIAAADIVVTSAQLMFRDSWLVVGAFVVLVFLVIQGSAPDALTEIRRRPRSIFVRSDLTY
ncbi:unnamed protein product [Angiostrongylus costaricensis]|uniref:Neur_chan_memb domain-containing protein n=1 Tax=Angiostrongylus costaricensis TaxID=334426 RepID=A0A0R3PS81_ANGCS|nr:unnamed protein product [Angiostrongylus costaricensis]